MSDYDWDDLSTERKICDVSLIFGWVIMFCVIVMFLWDLFTRDKQRYVLVKWIMFGIGIVSIAIGYLFMWLDRDYGGKSIY